MKERVVYPLIAHFSVHEEGDSVDLVAIETDGTFSCELYGPLVFPRYQVGAR